MRTILILVSFLLATEYSVAKAKRSVSRAPASAPQIEKKIVVIKMSPQSTKKKSKFERAMSPDRKLNQTVGVHFGSGHMKESDVEPLPQNLIAKVPILPDVPRAVKTPRHKKARRGIATQSPKVLQPKTTPEESLKDFRRLVDEEISNYD